jgi:hypothetical protein
VAAYRDGGRASPSSDAPSWPSACALPLLLALLSRTCRSTRSGQEQWLHTEMASSEYDYRTSSIDEDRSRAQEVYEPCDAHL